MFRVPLLTLLALTAAVRAQPCPDLASARAHLDASRPAEAQAVLEPIVDAHEACADGRFLLGQSLLAQGEWDAAADQLAEAIDLRDDVSEYHRVYGMATMEQLQRASMMRKIPLARRTRRAFARAVELDPSNADARLALGQYYLNAPRIAGGSVNRAREQADALVQLQPGIGYGFLGAIHEQDEEVEQATRAYEQALPYRPNDLSLLNALGTLYQGQERYGDAFAMYDRALTLAPDNPAIQYQFGKTTALSGQRMDEGIVALQAYIRFNDARPEPNTRLGAGAWWRIGMIYERRGDAAQARAAYEQSVSINPDRSNQARAALRALGG